jgi:SAM-dependent methyltransferase
LADVDFLDRELKLEKGMKILDLACGHGRHTIDLAKRGYVMTGLDLNTFFLDKAKKDADKAGVEVEWVRSDMREVPFEDEFDVVVNLFTAFGYLESDEEDQKVLQQVTKALKSGGQFLIDVINRDRIMRVFNPHDGKLNPDGSVHVTEREFDFTTSRNKERRYRLWPDGKTNDVTLSLRMYSLHELIRMCQAAGLE